MASRSTELALARLQQIRQSMESFNAPSVAAQKALGQYFTRLPLARILAALSCGPNVHSAIDPMCGIGDLLDATAERQWSCSVPLQMLLGVEIDESLAAVSAQRMAEVSIAYQVEDASIMTGDVFRALSCRTLSEQYDLVIANPPYVRYQRMAKAGPGVVSQHHALQQLLADASARLLPDAERSAWDLLVQAYPATADLAVPSWFLCSLLVKSGGRLGIVLPDAWLSRDYADVPMYMLWRFFHPEFIVRGIDAGWFGGAHVHTSLIVAERLATSDALIPLARRTPKPDESVLELDMDGNACTVRLVSEQLMAMGPCPSARGDRARAVQDVLAGRVSLRVREVHDLTFETLQRASRHKWYGTLEPDGRMLDRAAPRGTSVPSSIEVRECAGMTTFEQLCPSGIHVGQGLRTGCNDFFYARLASSSGAFHKDARIITGRAFGGSHLSVPSECLRLAVRHYRELSWPLVSSSDLTSVLLYLAGWFLPEDAEHLKGSSDDDTSLESSWKRLPIQLADHIRTAAQTRVGAGIPIPLLSAVRTNTGGAVSSLARSRGVFLWYMLPQLQSRHLASIFVPRVNHDSPKAYLKRDESVVVDANFVTVWSTDAVWTENALLALLNSSWMSLAMERQGTCLGGGALKVDAIQLRHARVPVILGQDTAALAQLGSAMTSAVGAADVLPRVDDLLARLSLPPGASPQEIRDTSTATRVRLIEARSRRQKKETS